MIKVIVFDFDGVIVDSNQMKYDAFFQIFPPDEKIKKTIKRTLDNHREKSRFYIIKKILTELKKEKKIDVYAKKYNDIVEVGAINCDEIKGARESLKLLSKKFPLFINSATPLDFLKRIIQKRSLVAFFKDIYGAPSSKTENLAEILKREKTSGKEAVVIGDGQSDLELAQRFGCRFIGIRNLFNNFTAQDFNILDDLRNLPNLINTLCLARK